MYFHPGSCNRPRNPPSNTLPSGGGFYNYETAGIIVRGCTFTGNTTEDSGGGASCTDGSTTQFINCLHLFGEVIVAQEFWNLNSSLNSKCKLEFEANALFH